MRKDHRKEDQIYKDAYKDLTDKFKDDYVQDKLHSLQDKAANIFKHYLRLSFSCKKDYNYHLKMVWTH